METMVYPNAATCIMIGIGVCGLAGVIIHYLRRIRLFVAACQFPGPRAWPIIGSAHYFIGNTENILRTIVEVGNAYPSPLRVWLGSRLFIGVHDAEQVKIILHSPKTIEKVDLYKFVRPWLNTGLLTAPASKWRVHRKLIQPTFNSKILESFVEVFEAQSEILVNEMKKELNKGEFSIIDYVSLCTLDIICETAMGVSVNAQTGGNCRFVECVRRIMEVICNRMFKIWLHPDIIFNLTSMARDQKECINYLHDITNTVIQQKKQALSSNHKQEDQTIKGEKILQRKAFLDLLMDLTHDGTKFTDEELREEVDTMMIAGNDTTASVTCFAMLMLASFPETQDKVHQELCDIYGTEVGSEKSIITHHDLVRMEYMERVLKETMRLFPVLPTIVRAVTDDLSLGKYTVPKGSSVVISVLQLHRSVKYWQNPMKFDPDRFLPDEIAKRYPYTYVPFSAGPRNCIGLQFGMMSMKTLLATIIRKYVLIKDNIVPVEDIKLKTDLLLKPVEPITIRIEKRAHSKLST